MGNRLPRQVFAHYMVGLTEGQTPEQWQKDVSDAKAASIDGFALNIGPADSYTLTQLHHAFSAAEENGFALFLSFDMATGTWSTDQVVSLVNEFKASPAYFTVDGLPFVSTFEGPQWADNWAVVRQGTGGIHLVPDWSSLGPYGVQSKLDILDGAFSWDAWPQPEQTHMTMDSDLIYTSVLQNKTFMMAVSPYFYTNLPQWSKNWYSSSESLWYDRWQHVLDILPDMVQIVTWNDFGESSYICDTVPRQIVEGANKYVDDFSHSAFRQVLPYFIAAYKSGQRSIEPPNGDSAIAWYKTTPAGAGSDGGTVWGQGGARSAALGARDVVSVVTISTSSGTVDVRIGDFGQTFQLDDCGGPACYFELPFAGNVGPVTLSMNGRTTTGPAIENICPQIGHVNFNSVVIQV